MSDPKAEQLVDALTRLLRPQLSKSPELREVCAALGQWLIQEAQLSAAAAGSVQNRTSPEAQPALGAAEPTGQTTSQAPTQATPPAATPTASGQRVVTGPSVIRGPVQPVSSATVPLKIGDTLVHVPVEGTTLEIGRARQAAQESLARSEPVAVERTVLDLALIVRRSRLKAESCRLYIQKRSAGTPEEEVELKRRMDEQIATAKSMPNCFLWVFWRERTQPDDDALRRIALCYDALATCTDLARRSDELSGGGGRRTDDEPAILAMLAEASSALRIALQDSWLVEDDRDQMETHLWLRQETAQRRIFISRHMAIDDPADPAGAASLIERAVAARGALEDQANKSKLVREQLNKVRYHARQIVSAKGADCDPHWRNISSAVRVLRDLGVPGTDDRIAEHLGAQAAELLPDGALPDVRESLSSALESALAQDQDSGGTDDPAVERTYSERVLQVRSWLRGRRMVLIGGEPRPRAILKLKAAFELGELDWVHLSEHGTGSPMRGPIERSDTALVVVIIKLTGHLHADEARDYAGRADKPVVLLKSGYSVEQIANAAVEQVSDRFAMSANQT